MLQGFSGDARARPSSRIARPNIRVRSVLTLGDFELFIVGDGCDRESAAIIRSMDDPRIRFYLLDKAWGTGDANRNIALREATGDIEATVDIVAYASDDDIVLPDHLQNLANLLKDKIQSAYSSALFVDTRGAGLLADAVPASAASDRARRQLSIERRVLPMQGMSIARPRDRQPLRSRL